jgi:hypothetical protein
VLEILGIGMHLFWLSPLLAGWVEIDSKRISRVAAPDFGSSATSSIIEAFANPFQAGCGEPIAGADHVESYRRGDRGSPRIL